MLLLTQVLPTRATASALQVATARLLSVFFRTSPDTRLSLSLRVPPSMTSATVSQQLLPISTELLQCLEQFSRHTQAIFDDLSRSSAQQQQPSAASTIAGTRADGLPYTASLAALTELSALDEKLAELLNKAQTHAENQKRIEELEDALLQHEMEWRKEVNQLEDDRKKLKVIVTRGKKDREAMEQARKGECWRPTSARKLSFANVLIPTSSRIEAVNHTLLRSLTGTLHFRSTSAQEFHAGRAGFQPG